MNIHIIGSFDRDTLYCTGSVTKFLTSYASLSLLSENFNLDTILDDLNFFDNLCSNQASRDFLTLFQQSIKSQFTLRDICSYYAGLPYTFDPSPHEIQEVNSGKPFKHHSILDEKIFLQRCKNNITPVYLPQSKFHYSEISIIFLAYFLETVYQIKMEELYQKFIIQPFYLTHSIFSRKRPENVYIQDLSNRYDSASIAIVDHGYFSYSNGFYTTLNDMKKLLEHLLQKPIFQEMVNLKTARAASNRLLNGLTIEMRTVKDDVIYGYEGLSFSGCNLWAYSTKKRQGCIIFHNSEEEVYKKVYDEFLGYSTFDTVTHQSQKWYRQFIQQYSFPAPVKDIPKEYQGHYQRVKINDFVLENIFTVGKDMIIVRSPDEIKYNIVYVNGNYCIKGKDNVHGSKVGFYKTQDKNYYMFFDGTLYKKMIHCS